ncbi:ACC2, partial [Symbiodinium sp. KB8]
MGCVASCAVRGMQESTSCYVPETFPTPPKVLPPDQRMHELYVCELNSYLMSVARNPQAFQDQVEMRLHVRLGTPPERKPESLKQLNMAEDAAWAASNFGDVKMKQSQGPQKLEVEREIKAREKQLLPLYTSVATTFADLHDR